MPIVHSLYREAGRPVIDGPTCTSCGRCARICPAEVLYMEAGRPRVSERSLLGCIACGHCMMVCPTGAVTVTGRGLSPGDLRPLPGPEARCGADALAALMLARRSIRHFRDEPVAPRLVERVVEMAATAPMGIPPWDVGCVSVIGRAAVREVARAVIGGYEQFLRVFRPWMLAALRPLMGRARYELYSGFIRPLAQSYVQAHREGHDKLFYDAPVLLVFHHAPYADALDAGIACTYAMLAAESLGLGSTMIGGAPPMLQRNRPLCRRLGIPEGNKPSVALVLGYPAVSFDRAIRRSFSRVNTIGAN